MKYIIIGLLLFTTEIFAQNISEGDKLIGGNIRGSIGKIKSQHTAKYSNFSINPKYGVFLTSKLVLGSGIQFSYFLNKNEIDFLNFKSETKSINLGITPFIRYYFSNQLFFQFRAGLLLLKTNQFDINNGVRNDYNLANRYQYTLAPGIGYNLFLTESLAIEGILSYEYIKSISDTEAFELNNNELQFSIGIQYYLKGNRSE
jgi:hypothetical protein